MKRKDLPGFEDLKRVFLGLCSNFSGDAFIVLDALDECEERQHRPLIRNLLESLVNSRVRLLIASRAHPPDINQLLGDCATITVSASPGDIRTFVLDRIEKSVRMVGMIDDKLRDEIVEKIVSKSQGM